MSKKLPGKKQTEYSFKSFFEKEGTGTAMTTTPGKVTDHPDSPITPGTSKIANLMKRMAEVDPSDEKAATKLLQEFQAFSQQPTKPAANDSKQDQPQASIAASEEADEDEYEVIVDSGVGNSEVGETPSVDLERKEEETPPGNILDEL